MSKLFKISLEETIEEPVIEDPIKNDTEEVSEAATKLAVEIEEMDNIAGQVVDVMQDVAKQVADNDDKLSDPDHVVTTIDVEVSEEAYKRACYKLGEKPEVVLSFANEAFYNDIKNNTEKYLVMSTETLKDTFIRLAYKIKNFILKIIEKLRLWYNKAELRFSHYTEKINKNVEFIKKGDLGWRNVWYEDAARSLLVKNRADIAYMIINNETNSFKLDTIEKNVYKLLSVSGDGMKGDELKEIQNVEIKYGYTPESKYDNNIVGIYGDNGLNCAQGIGFYKIKLKPINQDNSAKRFDARKLALDMAAQSTKYTKAIDRSKSVFDQISKIQKCILKDIDKRMADKNGETGYYKTREAYLHSKKSEATTCCTFLLFEYIETIKAYIDTMDYLVKQAEANLPFPRSK